PVDQAAREHFLLGGLALVLEEATRDTTRGVRELAIVHGEGQEVDAFTGVGRVTGRHEDDRVAHPDHDRTVGLLGQLAGLERDRSSAEFNTACVHWSCPCRLKCQGLFPALASLRSKPCRKGHAAARKSRRTSAGHGYSVKHERDEGLSSVPCPRPTCGCRGA